MSENTQGRYAPLVSLGKRGEQPTSRRRTMSCDVQMINSTSGESTPIDWNSLQRKWSLKEGLASGNRIGEQVINFPYENKEELDKTQQSMRSCAPLANGSEDLANKERISPHAAYPFLVGAQKKCGKECYFASKKPRLGNSYGQPFLSGSLRLENFTCPICLYVFYEPITLRCSHTFCRSCISQAVYGALNMNSCPVCRSELVSIFAILSLFSKYLAIRPRVWNHTNLLSTRFLLRLLRTFFLCIVNYPKECMKKEPVT